MPLRLPLEASLIAPNLWMGSRPPVGPTLQQCGVDVLVLCAYEHQPRQEFYLGVDVLRVALDDGQLQLPDAKRSFALASELAKSIRRGKRVLVTCSQGRNRSGLIVALTLTRLAGVSGAEAVRIVKARRHSPFGEALTNDAFVQALIHIPAAANPGVVTRHLAKATRDSRLLLRTSGL